MVGLKDFGLENLCFCFLQGSVVIGLRSNESTPFSCQFVLVGVVS